MLRTYVIPAICVLGLSACVTTGDPTANRALIGAAGGAAVGQLLGKDTGAAVAGAILGSAVGAATAKGRQTTQARSSQTSAAHPCADIAARTDLHPEAKADLCYERQNPVGE